MQQGVRITAGLARCHGDCCCRNQHLEKCERVGLIKCELFLWRPVGVFLTWPLMDEINRGLDLCLHVSLCIIGLNSHKKHATTDRHIHTVQQKFISECPIKYSSTSFLFSLYLSLHISLVQYLISKEMEKWAGNYASHKWLYEPGLNDEYLVPLLRSDPGDNIALVAPIYYARGFKAAH